MFKAPKKTLEEVLKPEEILRIFFDERNGFGSRATEAKIQAAGRSVVQSDAFAHASRLKFEKGELNPDIKAVLAQQIPGILENLRDK